ncbi:MAG: hypothetical protein AAGA09_06670 [Pseudomonadota bacterium]
MRAFICIATLAVAYSSPASANADNGRPGLSIGNGETARSRCFENARDGNIAPDTLTPCNTAINDDALTTRQRAIAYANRGVVNYNIGDYDAAALDFTAALDLEIHVVAKMHVNRGLAYEALGLDALARADYRAALAVNDENVTARQRLDELKKPLYERARAPRRITTEAPRIGGPGI